MAIGQNENAIGLFLFVFCAVLYISRKDFSHMFDARRDGRSTCKSSHFSKECSDTRKKFRRISWKPAMPSAQTRKKINRSQESHYRNGDVIGSDLKTKRSLLPFVTGINVK
jgi:hypothetical protein